MAAIVFILAIAWKRLSDMRSDNGAGGYCCMVLHGCDQTSPCNNKVISIYSPQKPNAGWLNGAIGNGNVGRNGERCVHSQVRMR
jgi:hypothetical protein